MKLSMNNVGDYMKDLTAVQRNAVIYSVATQILKWRDMQRQPRGKRMPCFIVFNEAQGLFVTDTGDGRVSYFWHPFRSADADYAVLRHVGDKWPRVGLEMFTENLQSLHNHRMKRGLRPNMARVTSPQPLLYIPGDYAVAAGACL